MSSTRGGAFIWGGGLATLSTRGGFFWPMSVERRAPRIGPNPPHSNLRVLGLRFVLADDTTPETTFAEIRRGPMTQDEYRRWRPGNASP